MEINIMCISHFWDFKFVDFVLPALTILALLIAYFQLKVIRKHKKIEFTYQLYRDFFNYLNDERNEKLKNWLFGKDENEIIERNKIGDLLEQFEAIWSLQNKKLVEKDVVYDLFSFYIIKASVAKNPSALEYIDDLRKEENDLFDFTDDIFIGYESLLKQMKSKESYAKRDSKKTHKKNTKTVVLNM